jgi:uncharacterized protein YjbI with pentapeptide repeats
MKKRIKFSDVYNLDFLRERSNDFKMSDIIMIDEKLINMDFTGVYICGSIFIDCIFEDLNLIEGSFSGSIFINCIFKSCKIVDRSWWQSKMQYCQFDTCNFTKTDISDSEISNVLIKNSILIAAGVIDCELKNVTFEKNKLRLDYRNNKEENVTWIENEEIPMVW